MMPSGLLSMKKLGYKILDALFLLSLVVSLLAISLTYGIAHEIAPQEDGDMLTSMLSEQDLSPYIIALTTAVAIVLGAIHALSPGHGKALVAAYLVGTRSRARDALLLGGIVTMTHTAGVFLLGIIALLASNWLLPERILPWLSVVSGLIVFGVGAYMLYNRLSHHHGHRDQHHHNAGHDHHSHPHSDTHFRGRLDRTSLWALGVSGGALPCPSALMLLLTAVALERIAFGLILLLAFSFGLGAVLTFTGWLFLKAGRVIDRFSSAKTLKGLPVLSAGVIMVLGLAISIRAVQSIL
jgi:nickel/cobalt exporter